MTYYRQRKAEIVYPIFLQVSQYTKDKYWAHLFEDLAYGVCPYGIDLSDDSIQCKFKGKEFIFIFVGKEPRVIYDNIHNLFNKHLKISSKMDLHCHQQHFSKSLEHDGNYVWSEIKKKNIKDVLVQNYVIDMTAKYTLTLKQARRLLGMIMIGFQFKLLSNKDVMFDSNAGRIIDIDGITFKNSIIYMRNMLDIVPELRNDDTLQVGYLQYHWDKYLSQF